MQVIHVEEGQTIGEALAQAGAPDEVVSLMNNIFGTDPAGPELSMSMFAARADLEAAQAEEEEDDEDFDLDVDFEPDFELSDETEVPLQDKIDSVAQLGRIIEGLTLLVEDHAALVKKLVA
ncbi:hypothetical protein ACTG4Q_21105 [Bradyrhizobium denitrificans]